jgi:hypothetical protein
MVNHETRHVRLLEKCASLPLQGHDDEWEELMRVLRFPLNYWTTVKEVLDQGRWRHATDPVRYIRAAASREWRKREEVKRSGPYRGCISELLFRRKEDGRLMKHDEVIEYWIARARDDRETPYMELRVRPELLIAESEDYDAVRTVDYSKLMDRVAAEAGLSRSQRNTIELVLQWRAYFNLTREQILNQPDARLRKRLQAAWRWISRNKALLASVLSGKAVNPSGRAASIASARRSRLKKNDRV